MKKGNSLSEILREFEEIASWDYREIASHLPKDRIPIGFFCPYVPEELLHSAGALPIRLMGAPTKISHALAHLPPYCCYLVKSSLESFLQGELDFLKGVIFSHTCDTMQGLSDIWALQRRLPILFDLMIPTRLDTESSRHYLKAEIERFKDYLETHLGKVSLENLKASIHLFNQIRGKIGEIYARRKKNSEILPGGSFAQMIRAGYLVERMRYLGLLDELLAALPITTNNRPPLIPIYLTGNMTHAPSWFSLIEDAGAQAVQDDLCGGARSLRLMVPEHLDPIEGLTERYFSSFFCPTKYRGIQAHLETLLKEVQESGARGVIFLLYKYCEAHFFDYPDLKVALEAKGVPTLLLEVEDPTTSMGQLKIRIQAFVEMLSPF